MAAGVKAMEAGHGDHDASPADRVGVSGDVPGGRPAGALPRLALPGAVLRGSLWGGALGVWWAGWVLAGIWMCELLWLVEPWVASSPWRVRFEDVWELLARGAAWWPEQAWGLAVLGFVVGGAVGVMGAGIVHLLRMDPARRAREAMVWGARVSARGWRVWAVPVPGLMALVVAARLWVVLEPAAFAVLAAVLVAAVMLAPFAVLRREVLLDRDGRGWWRPRWPGVGPVCAAVGLSAVAWLVVTFGGMFEAVLGGAAEAGVVAVASLLNLGAVCALVWRAGPGELWRSWRRVLQWRLIGPWLLLLNVRVMVLVLWLVAPVAVVYLPVWKSLPVLATVYEHHGRLLPYWFELLFNVVLELGEVWWVGALVPAAAFLLMLAGRVVVTVDGERSA